MPGSNIDLFEAGKNDEMYEGKASKEWPTQRMFQNMEEVKEEVEMKVHGGVVPEWLSGSLYRIGPATFNVERGYKPAYELQHWFDGLGQLQKFTIRDGRVFYRSRNTCDAVYHHLRTTGKYPGISFGRRMELDDPCRKIFAKFVAYFIREQRQQLSLQDFKKLPTSANISVTMLANPPIPDLLMSSNGLLPDPSCPFDRLVLTTDANMLQSVCPRTLEPLEKFSYGKSGQEFGKGQLSASHSSVDPRTGEVFNFVLEMGVETTWVVFALGPKIGEKRILARIKDKDAPAAYLHSLLFTDEYVILTVWQSDFRMNGAAILLEGSVASAIKPWDPMRRATFFVIPRSGNGVIKKYTSSPFFCFHTINAFIDPSLPDNLYLDYCAYDNSDIIDSLYISNILKHGNRKLSRLRRYKLDLRNDEGEAEMIWQLGSEYALELPTINSEVSGRGYKFVYGTHRHPKLDSGTFDSIIKISVPRPFDSPYPESQESIDLKPTVQRWGRPGCMPSEPIFIPTPNAKEEDDGILLVSLLDGIDSKSYLVGLNSQSLEEVFIAELGDKKAFGIGFHGVFGRGRT